MTVEDVRPDLDRLLKLRLVVGRYGEMDLARWWNTEGMLGRYGAIALRRGLPTTHRFAQARVVFAVARSRCQQVFDPPGCVTLWHLSADVEDAFEERWHTWLDETDRWKGFFDRLTTIEAGSLLDTLETFGLITEPQREAASKLHHSGEGRAVPLPGLPHLDDELVTLLAAGFSRSQVAELAVPYARLEASR